MSMILRYPNGQAVTYNHARYVTYRERVMILYTKTEGGDVVAIIPYESGAVVEFVEACKVENPVMGLTDEAALVRVLANLRDYRGLNKERIAELKRELTWFNAKKMAWMGGGE